MSRNQQRLCFGFLFAPEVALAGILLTTCIVGTAHLQMLMHALIH